MNDAEALQAVNYVCFLFGVCAGLAAVAACAWAVREFEERKRLENENRRLRRVVPMVRVFERN